MDPLQNNEAIERFRQLLSENGRYGQAEDLSALLWYMDGMNRQYEAVLHELQEVRQQLAQEREPVVKYMVQNTLRELEHRMHQIKESLDGLWEKVAECAAGAVRDFREVGVLALDKAVSTLNAKDTLKTLQENISGMISAVKHRIEDVEHVGHELRSAGDHLKNAGRAMIGKEMQAVDGGREGRFQSAVLAPMRSLQGMLCRMNNTTLAAIGNMEYLEEVATATREVRTERKTQRPGKRLAKKPSIRKALEEKRAEIAARSPAEQAVKAKEVVL